MYHTRLGGSNLQYSHRLCQVPTLLKRCFNGTERPTPRYISYGRSTRCLPRSRAKRGCERLHAREGACGCLGVRVGLAGGRVVRASKIGKGRPTQKAASGSIERETVWHTLRSWLDSFFWAPPLSFTPDCLPHIEPLFLGFLFPLPLFSRVHILFPRDLFVLRFRIFSLVSSPCRSRSFFLFPFPSHHGFLCLCGYLTSNSSSRSLLAPKTNEFHHPSTLQPTFAPARGLVIEAGILSPFTHTLQFNRSMPDRI